ncbi:hypothetical protein FEM48_Zijuj11G0082500 [Ziziphus jujuba var. spinosa]|uniref:Transmembrane protein n=1 Tax=Ziziphus jujuba var. spinosa TaxID=714518 RepID=A0A978UHU0_ZIZJJ|nr:hypothetical protein FEM48_Zijuj11G0082500 [Ziziphus jujuba var. spinosa]
MIKISLFLYLFIFTLSSSPCRSTVSGSAAISSASFRCFDPTNFFLDIIPDQKHYFFSNSIPNSTPRENSKASMGISINSKPNVVARPTGYVLEDVPHLFDYIPDLSVISLCLSLSLLRVCSVAEKIYRKKGKEISSANGKAGEDGGYVK